MLRRGEVGSVWAGNWPPVRATILAVSRFEIASRDVTKKIEKEWAKYWKLHDLDLYGNREPQVSQAPDCGHA